MLVDVKLFILFFEGQVVYEKNVTAKHLKFSIFAEINEVHVWFILFFFFFNLTEDCDLYLPKIKM